MTAQGILIMTFDYKEPILFIGIYIEDQLFCFKIRPFNNKVYY